jgi:transcriptional regulator with XRE-family HTH domain
MNETSKLRIAREARGLSLREAAELAGIDPAQLSRLERGQAGASLNTVLRVAQVLGLRRVREALAPFLGE